MSRLRLPSSALAVALGVALLGTGLTACGDDDPESPMVEPDDVYLAVVHWQLDRLDQAASTSPTTTSEGGDLPVIYVATTDGSKIPAEVQATVAHAAVDVATVRFADSRDEALELDEEGEPVRDGGILLSIAPVDPETTEHQRTVEVEVETYRSLDDVQTLMLTIGSSHDGATVTSSTLQPS